MTGYYIYGAIRFTSSRQAAQSIGVVVYSPTTRPSNVLFLAHEDRSGNISRFLPIVSDDVYHAIVKVRAEDMMHIDDAGRIRDEGAPTAYCYFDGDRAHYYDRAVLQQADDDAREFLGYLEGSRSYSAMSALGALRASFSEKLRFVQSLPLGADRVWRNAELSFFQRSGQYWDIVERAHSLPRNSDSLNQGIPGTLHQRLEYLMNTPPAQVLAGTTGRKWERTWISLSDRNYQTEILHELGIRFLEVSDLFDSGTLQIANRLDVDFGSKELEGVIDNFADQMREFSKVSVGLSFHQVDTGIRTHKLVTLNLIRGSRLLGGPDPLVNRNRDFSSRAAAVSFEEVHEQLEMMAEEASTTKQYNASIHFDWIVASSAFVSAVGLDRSGAAREILKLLYTALVAFDDSRLSTDEVALLAKTLLSENEQLLRPDSNTGGDEVL